MFGKLLKSVTCLVNNELKKNLHGNPDYRKYRWNTFERFQAWCSKHYGWAMLLLWASAIFSVLTSIYFKPVFTPFAAEYLKGIEKIPPVRLTLLGGQLTIIGIVFPLVVGLISVLFQKKSTRVHIQSAYQLYSGYMFAGLSGLSLAAFILISEIISTWGDDYINISLTIVALFWMTMNIGLSIWFFIQSLNVLDDRKRDRIMLKYYISEVVMKYIKSTMVSNWLDNPAHYLDKEKISHNLANMYSFSNKNKSTILKIKNNKQVIDVYIYPLLHLLRLVKSIKGEKVYFSILPKSGVHNNELPILTASEDIKYNFLWIWVLKILFVSRNKNDKVNHYNLTRDFYGEIYDALNELNLGAFEGAVDRLESTFIILRKSFQHAEGNYIENVSFSYFDKTFSQSFYYELYRLSEDVVKTLDSTSVYFRRITHFPSSLYRYNGENRNDELNQTLISQVHLWSTLVEWNIASRVMSANQEQRYTGMLRYFIGEWESWHMWLRLEFKNNDEVTKYAEAIELHLLHSLEIIITAITSDDKYATDFSTDMFNMWLNQSKNNRNRYEEYLRHSHFITPDFLTSTTDSYRSKLLKGNECNEENVLSLIIFNVINDLRLFLASYILIYAKDQNNINIMDIINRLLTPSLVYSTGAHINFPPKIANQNDIIDIIIRLVFSRDWCRRLSSMVEKLTRNNRSPMIPGRIYMASMDDIQTLYSGFTDIAVMLSISTQRISKKITSAIDDNIFSFSDKKNIVYILESLKKEELFTSENSTTLSEDYSKKTILFNRSLNDYITAFENSINNDIEKSKIDTGLIKSLDIHLSKDLINKINDNYLLSLFNLESEFKPLYPWKRERTDLFINKEDISINLGSTIEPIYFTSDDIVKKVLRSIHTDLYYMKSNLMEKISDLPSLFGKLIELTDDGDDYTLIIYGDFFINKLNACSDFCEKYKKSILTYEGKTFNHLLPYGVQNCNIYNPPGYQEGYSLLIKNSSLKHLRLFRYPDETMFCSFYRADNHDQIKGMITHMLEYDFEITAPVVAMFVHESH